MITSLSVLLLNDVLFKKDADNNYKLNTKNEFIHGDINEILDRISENVTEYYKVLSQRNPFLNECEVYIDYIALKQVLIKYSRDVFGQKRLLAILKKVPNYKTHLSSMETFGIKINSFNPYIHRRAGCFIYWCCVLKPFHIKINNENLTVPKEQENIIQCFNEEISYNLVRMMLASCSILKYCTNAKCELKKLNLTDNDCYLKININDDSNFFNDFLYDVHFRALSRSSLELFMSKFCVIPHCVKGTCPLTSFDLQNKNLKFIDEFEEDVTEAKKPKEKPSLYKKANQKAAKAGK
ncbi:MAG: hypothetical protein FWB95_08255 [Treponema sp.]|nr:hypothetical protein [Treponema sp.]